MNPQASLARTYRWALVIDEQELRRMVDECQRALAQEDVLPENIAWRFELTFSDGLSLTTDSIDEVVAEENPRRRSITGITIYADLDVPKRSASITCRIGTEKPQQTSITVTGSDRNWVHVTFSKIEERLRRMKQWHARPATVRFNMLWLSMIFVVALWVTATKRYPKELVEVGADGQAVTTYLGTVVLLSMLAFVVAAIACVPPLLPGLTFRLGDGVARHDKLKSARWALGWAVVSGLLGVAVLSPVWRFVIGLFW